jgi:hypothetical protein
MRQAILVFKRRSLRATCFAVLAYMLHSDRFYDTNWPLYVVLVTETSSISSQATKTKWNSSELWATDYDCSGLHFPTVVATLVHIAGAAASVPARTAMPVELM